MVKLSSYSGVRINNGQPPHLLLHLGPSGSVLWPEYSCNKKKTRDSNCFQSKHFSAKAKSTVNPIVLPLTVLTEPFFKRFGHKPEPNQLELKSKLCSDSTHNFLKAKCCSPLFYWEYNIQICDIALWFCFIFLYSCHNAAISRKWRDASLTVGNAVRLDVNSAPHFHPFHSPESCTWGSLWAFSNSEYFVTIYLKSVGKETVVGQ